MTKLLRKDCLCPKQCILYSMNYTIASVVKSIQFSGSSQTATKLTKQDWPSGFFINPTKQYLILHIYFGIFCGTITNGTINQLLITGRNRASYNISMVVVSAHLPSSIVGPVSTESEWLYFLCNWLNHRWYKFNLYHITSLSTYFIGRAAEYNESYTIAKSEILQSDMSLQVV